MINVGIAGYGNLGKGVESALSLCQDMRLIAVFTRRDPSSITLRNPDIPVLNEREIINYRDKIDVMILCGGSATDLPVQGPAYAGYFNTVDSFDTHALIPEYFAAMDTALTSSGKVGVISVGWDPGLFSLNRIMSDAVIPDGVGYTFWGRGVSQGHSDAIRRIPGVADAKQYTVPVDSVVEEVRNGSSRDYTTREKHRRECYVVAEEGADLAEIEHRIVTMPNYFADYDTTVCFISKAEFERDLAGLPHAGFVIRNGKSVDKDPLSIEFSLKLGSNPQFTAGVMVAYARAVARLALCKETGARTIMDIAPGLISPLTPDELRRTMI